MQPSSVYDRLTNGTVIIDRLILYTWYIKYWLPFNFLRVSNGFYSGLFVCTSFFWFLSSLTMFPSDPLLQLLCHIFFLVPNLLLKSFFAPLTVLLSSISCTPSEMENLKSRDHIWKSVVWGPFTILLRWYCSGIWDLCCFHISLGIAYSNSVRNVTGILMGSTQSL